MQVLFSLSLLHLQGENRHLLGRLVPYPEKFDLRVLDLVCTRSKVKGHRAQCYHVTYAGVTFVYRCLHNPCTILPNYPYHYMG